MMFGGLLASARFVNKLFFIQVSPFPSIFFSTLIFQKTCLILVTMIVTASSIKQLQAKTGLPLLNRVVGWSALGALHRP